MVWEGGPAVTDSWNGLTSFIVAQGHAEEGGDIPLATDRSPRVVRSTMRIH